MNRDYQLLFDHAGGGKEESHTLGKPFEANGGHKGACTTKAAPSSDNNYNKPDPIRRTVERTPNWFPIGD
ncbi:hypothetical protein [Paenibacillus gorillae]|uniref:hypothetical protein n=1 Tax=Paenibacillus gorillae TaxID=1243662 RepID=UPI0005A8FBAC|nr:hypothetical protein [Paenibacillus gorillae]